MACADSNSPTEIPATNESRDDPGRRRQELVNLLRRLGAEFNDLGRAFASLHDLHKTDLTALVRIMEANEAQQAIGPGALGERLGLSSASVTALIDRLEEVGHVRRDRDVSDRRRVVLRPEPGAMRLGAEFFGPLNRRMFETMHHFDDAELETVRRFLTLTIENVAAEHRRGS